MRESDLPEFDRAQHAHLDETGVIAELLSERADGTMIDVGAHHGSALAPFLRAGWSVLAFEPDPVNRHVLEERWGDHPGLRVDERAVTDTPGQRLPFYHSDVSSGISSLSPFHESHEQRGQVETTTLTEALDTVGIESVAFLKVDTEGHDLFVLQGLDWGRFDPDVIECEFEDSKTAPLGYDYHDLARYLLDRGYQVWVSEWHPVIRYGIRHDWRRLARYPCDLRDEQAWGNLIALRPGRIRGRIGDVVQRQARWGPPVEPGLVTRLLSRARRLLSGR